MFYFGCIFREYYETKDTTFDDEFEVRKGYDGYMLVGIFSKFDDGPRDRQFNFIFAKSPKLKSNLISDYRFSEKQSFPRDDRVRNSFKIISQKFN